MNFNQQYDTNYLGNQKQFYDKKKSSDDLS